MKAADVIKENANILDKQFIAEQRGGPLKKEQYYQLIQWACDCSNMYLISSEKIDED